MTPYSAAISAIFAANRGRSSTMTRHHRSSFTSPDRSTRCAVSEQRVASDAVLLGSSAARPSPQA
jgi:hypothetical protein